MSPPKKISKPRSTEESIPDEDWLKQSPSHVNFFDNLSDSDEDDFNDNEEVFIPSESDRELQLVSRVAHARRMRFNFKQ